MGRECFLGPGRTSASARASPALRSGRVRVRVRVRVLRVRVRAADLGLGSGRALGVGPAQPVQLGPQLRPQPARLVAVLLRFGPQPVHLRPQR
jgi:hypothetical protein